MINAFVKSADGTATCSDSAASIAEVWPGDGTEVWVDLETPTDEEIRQVGELFNLDAEALEDCLHGEQRPRIDEFEDSIFLVFYGVPMRDGTPGLTFRKVAAFCGSRFLITVHREPLTTVAAVRDRCSRHTQQTMAKGVDFVLYLIIDGMVDQYILAGEFYEDRLDELEGASLEPGVEETLLAGLSDLRRQMLELRRIAASQRDLLMPVAKGEYDFISESLEIQFIHVKDHLTKVVEVLDGLRELLNGVRDNYNAALASRMNSVMKTLTIFATIMLPLSLIAGIYGMNLPLWPTPDQPASFWAVLLAMTAIAVGLLVYFRRRKWL